MPDEKIEFRPFEDGRILTRRGQSGRYAVLDTRLLDDPRFRRLSDSDKLVYLLCRLLYHRLGRAIPMDTEWFKSLTGYQGVGPDFARISRTRPEDMLILPINDNNTHQARKKNNKRKNPPLGSPLLKEKNKKKEVRIAMEWQSTTPPPIKPPSPVPICQPRRRGRPRKVQTNATVLAHGPAITQTPAPPPNLSHGSGPVESNTPVMGEKETAYLMSQSSQEPEILVQEECPLTETTTNLSPISPETHHWAPWMPITPGSDPTGIKTFEAEVWAQLSTFEKVIALQSRIKQNLEYAKCVKSNNTNPQEVVKVLKTLKANHEAYLEQLNLLKKQQASELETL